MLALVFSFGRRENPLGGGALAKIEILVQGGFDPIKISDVGTSFGLLFHVLSGPNKEHAFKKRIILS